MWRKPGSASRPTSSAERKFLQRALRESPPLRSDGRGVSELRSIAMTLRRGMRADDAESHAEVRWGKTRVLTVVSAEIVRPFADRPIEGTILFGVELSSMAVDGHSSGARAAPFAVELRATLEAVLRDGRVIDTEALCIVPGEKVWALRIDVHVMDDDGNVGDAAVLSALAALKHFRRPHISYEGQGAGAAVRVHTFEERTPVALSIHHVPFSVSFALFDLPGVKAGGSGKAASHSDESTSEVRLAIDPTALEQSIMDGRLSFVLNAHREVVAVRKSSSGSGGAGCAVPQDLVMRGMLQAVASVATLDAVLTAALVEGEAEAERVRLSARPTE